MTGSGLRPAIGVRNALIIAPLAWVALIVVALFLVGVI